MEIIIWNSLITLSKVGFYTGFTAVFSVQCQRFLIQGQTQNAEMKRRQQAIPRVGLFAGLCSLILVPVWFLASTGAMVEDGIAGMLDPFMLEMMWDSAVGDTTFLRFVSMSVTLVLLLVLLTSPSYKTANPIWNITYIASLCGMAFSFTLTGHVSELGLFERGLIMLHVLVMTWWFGALLPLKSACVEFDSKELHNTMHRFGKQASILVPLLLLAGVILAFQLTGSISALVASRYGQVLLIKLIAVVLILALAAYHKFRLVPSLLSENQDSELTKLKLSKSINIEIGLAFLILVATACLTSLVGPEGMN